MMTPVFPRKPLDRIVRVGDPGDWTDEFSPARNAARTRTMLKRVYDSAVEMRVVETVYDRVLRRYVSVEYDALHYVDPERVSAINIKSVSRYGYQIAKVFSPFYRYSNLMKVHAESVAKSNART